MYLGYVRVSTGKQTVENQMFAIEDFCAHQNPPIHIDDWIIETASGMKHFDKRKLGKKLQSVTSDDTIISTEITRLGRSLLMIFSIMAYCLGKGCGIWTIKEGWRLGDNLTSKVLAFAFGLAAEIERALISERTRDALARKRRRASSWAAQKEHLASTPNSPAKRRLSKRSWTWETAMRPSPAP